MFKSPSANREITALCLGGSKGARDKIYAASGQTITGFKKKGQSFFNFSTHLNEDINNLVIEDNTIWTACEYVVNVFEDCKDAHFFMANGALHDACSSLQFLTVRDCSQIVFTTWCWRTSRIRARPTCCSPARTKSSASSKQALVSACSQSQLTVSTHVLCLLARA